VEAYEEVVGPEMVASAAGGMESGVEEAYGQDEAVVDGVGRADSEVGVAER
jgi:hypothetical protein